MADHLSNLPPHFGLQGPQMNFNGVDFVLWFKNHIYNHHSAEGGFFHCSYCSRMILYKSESIVHITSSGEDSCPAAQPTPNYVEIFSKTQGPLSLGSEPGSRGKCKSIIYKGRHKWIMRKSTSYKNKIEFVSWEGVGLNSAYAVKLEERSGWRWYIPIQLPSTAHKPATHVVADASSSTRTIEEEFLQECGQGLTTWKSSFPLDTFWSLVQRYSTGQEEVLYDGKRHVAVPSTSAQQQFSSSMSSQTVVEDRTIQTMPPPAARRPRESTADAPGQSGNQSFLAGPERNCWRQEELHSPPSRLMITPTTNMGENQATAASSVAETSISANISVDQVLYDDHPQEPAISPIRQVFRRARREKLATRNPLSFTISKKTQQSSQSFSLAILMRERKKRLLKSRSSPAAICTTTMQYYSRLLGEDGKSLDDDDDDERKSSFVSVRIAPAAAAGFLSTSLETVQVQHKPPPPPPPPPPPQLLTSTTTPMRLPRRANNLVNELLRSINPTQATFFATQMNTVGILYQHHIYQFLDRLKRPGVLQCHYKVKNNNALLCLARAELSKPTDLTTLRMVKNHVEHPLPPLRDLFLPTSVKYFGISASGVPTHIITEQGIKFKFVARHSTHASFKCEISKHCQLKYLENFGFFVKYATGVHSHSIVKKNSGSTLSQFKDGMHKLQIQKKRTDRPSYVEEGRVLRPCPHCGHQFNRRSLVKHLSNKDINRPFQCEHCCEGFLNQRALSRHSNLIHYVPLPNLNDVHRQDMHNEAHVNNQDEISSPHETTTTTSSQFSLKPPQLAPYQMLKLIPTDIRLPVVKVAKKIKALQIMVLEHYKRVGRVEAMESCGQIFQEQLRRGKTPDLNSSDNTMWSSIPGAESLILFDTEQQVWRFLRPPGSVRVGWVSACAHRGCPQLHQVNISNPFCRKHDPCAENVIVLAIDESFTPPDLPVYIEKIHFKDSSMESESPEFERQLRIGLRQILMKKKIRNNNMNYRKLKFERFRGTTRLLQSEFRLFLWRVLVYIRTGLCRLQAMEKSGGGGGGKMKDDEAKISSLSPFMTGSKIPTCSSALLHLPAYLEDNKVQIKFLDLYQYCEKKKLSHENYFNVRKVSLTNRSDPITAQLSPFFKLLLESQVSGPRRQYWTYLIRFSDGAVYVGVHFGNNQSTISESHGTYSGTVVSKYFNSTRLHYTSTVLDVEDSKLEAEIMESRAQLIVMLAFAHRINVYDTFNPGTYTPVNLLLNKRLELKSETMSNLDILKQLAFRLCDRYMSIGPVPECSTYAQLCGLIIKDLDLNKIDLQPPAPVEEENDEEQSDDSDLGEEED